MCGLNTINGTAGGRKSPIALRAIASSRRTAMAIGFDMPSQRTRPYLTLACDELTSKVALSTAGTRKRNASHLIAMKKKKKKNNNKKRQQREKETFERVSVSERCHLILARASERTQASIVCCILFRCSIRYDEHRSCPIHYSVGVQFTRRSFEERL